MFDLYEKKETKSKTTNGNLHKAKQAKNDEFYTQLSDIEKELMHYKPHFKDKIVYCNCDDPEWSNFWKYFHLNFAHLGLKKLIATFYHIGQSVYKMEYTGGDDNNISAGVKIHLTGNGDFRSDECIETLKESDIIVTNPPFSMFREYVAQLMECGKKFIIIGNPNAVTYKEFFPLLKNNQVWVGAKPWSAEMYFGVPKEQEEYLVAHKKEGSAYVIKDGQILGRVATVWFTNLDHSKRHEKLPLYKTFNQEEYPIYDNYAAWNVDRVADIPMDKVFELTVDEETYKRLKDTYGNDLVLIDTDNGYHINVSNPIIGVPITFLDKFNPEQFEIVVFRKGEDGKDLIFTNERESSTVLSYLCTTAIPGMIKNAEGKICGNPTYARITIRKI